MTSAIAPSKVTICVTLAALAAVLTASGIAKPILWDDEVYFQFAQHIAHHPFDPYGLSIWIGGRSSNGLNVLAPPFLLYWWAGAIAVFGNNVSLTAFALLPFAVAYTVGFYVLGRRFAQRDALPLTVVASTSAWAMVSFNYMMDFPDVALNLMALALFVTGTDSDRKWLVTAAGVVTALALETKYSGVTTCAAIVIYGWFARRPLWTLLALAIAGAIFVGTEFAIFLKYGQSHFLLHLGARSNEARDAVQQIPRLRELLYGLVANAGPLAIGLLVIGPSALGWNRLCQVTNFVFVIFAFSMAALGFDHVLNDVLSLSQSVNGPTLLTLSGMLGLLWVSQSLLLAERSRKSHWVQLDRDAVFLIAWCAVAVIIYFGLSPFPAARRLGDILAISTLTFGRAVGTRVRNQPNVLWWAAGTNAATGLVMLSISLVDAANVATTAQAALAEMRKNVGFGESWHMTSLSMARYFTNAGVRPIDQGKSILQAGDIFALDLPSDDIRIDLNADGLRELAVIKAGINLGVEVSTEFYRFKLPWTSQRDTRPRVIIYGVTKPTAVELKIN